MKNKKKKGFTLIELIVVIAILGILGAILAPKLTGYTNKANKANLQSSAKVIMNAIIANNADATTPLTYDSTLTAAMTAVNTNGAIVDTTATNFTTLQTAVGGGTSLVGKVKAVADGNFTYSSSTGLVTLTTTAPTGNIP